MVGTWPFQASLITLRIVLDNEAGYQQEISIVSVAQAVERRSEEAKAVGAAPTGDTNTWGCSLILIIAFQRIAKYMWENTFQRRKEIAGSNPSGPTIFLLIVTCDVV